MYSSDRESISFDKMIALCILALLVVAPLTAIAVPSPAGVGPAPAMPDGSRAADDWPMFLYSANRNSVTTSPGPTSDQLLWENSTGGLVYSSPIVAEGKVFVGSTDGKIYAFDANTGHLIWANATGTGSDYGVSSTAAYSNGYVIALSNSDDDLYSLNASTGEQRWKADLGSGGYGGSSPVVSGGKVYVGSPNGRLYVIDETDGSEDWNFPIGASGANGYGVESAPSVVDGVVYFGGGDDVFRAVNISTHNLVWSYDLDQRGYSGGAVVNGVVYTSEGVYNVDGCANCKVYAFDVDGFSDGNDGWAGEASTGPTDGDVIWTNNVVGMTLGTPTVYKGYVYVGSRDNTFYAMNASTGTVEWSYTANNDFMASASIADDIVIISSKDRKVYAFDYNGFDDGNDGWTGEANTGAADGDILWNYTLGSEIWSSAAISNGVVYIAEHGNTVTAVGTPSVDVFPPQVLETSPGADEINVTLGKTISIHFSEALDPSSATASNVTLVDSGSNPVSGTVAYDAGKVNITFDPDADLLPHEEYTATVRLIKDTIGNAMTASHIWSFTTVNRPPTLTDGAVSPSSGNMSTRYEFSVVYTDLDDDPPSGDVRVHIDGDPLGKVMQVNTSASADHMDGDYTNGENYVYNQTFATGGNHTFYFKVTDGFDENITITVTGPFVQTPNMPPFISSISAQTATEDIPVIFDLEPYVSDPDNAKDELTWTVDSDFATGTSGWNSTFVFDENATTNEVATFNVSDGENTVSADVAFHVTKVNDPPIFTPLPDYTVRAEVPREVDLMDYVYDVDTDRYNLSAVVDTIQITIVDMVMTLNYTPDITEEEVYLEIDDGATTVSDHFNVTVTQGENTGPTIGALPTATPREDEVTNYDLDPYVTDDGLPTGTLMASVTSDYVTANGLVLRMLYPQEVTSDTLTVTVTDGELSATATLEVSVTLVNDAPVLRDWKMSKVYADNGDTLPAAYDFDVVAEDVDSTDITATLMIDNTSYPMTKVTGDPLSGIEFQVSVNRGDLAVGTHTYYFKADDGEGAANSVVETAKFTFEVPKKKKAPSSDGDGLGGMLIPILLVVVIAVVVVVLVMVMRGKRKGQAPAAVPPPQPGGPAQVDLISGQQQTTYAPDQGQQQQQYDQGQYYQQDQYYDQQYQQDGYQQEGFQQEGQQPPEGGGDEQAQPQPQEQPQPEQQPQPEEGGGGEPPTPPQQPQG